MYVIELEPFNYAVVFGVALGMYIVTNIDVIARNAVTFVKGWRS